MPLDPRSHIPIYEQIMEHIHGSVVAGVYASDEPLPSIRALALEFVVNPNTVQRAYQELERQGLIYMRRGLGAFVAKDGSDKAQGRLEDVLVERFTRAIQVGQAASVSPEQIEKLFQKAMTAAFASSPGKQTDGDSAPARTPS